MGYYSDVAISMYESDYDKLCEKVNAANRNIRFFVGAAEAYKSSLGDKKAVTLVWNWVKWYPEFEDVKFISDFLGTLSNYSFKRFGEDIGDYEEVSNGCSDELAELTYVEQHFSIGCNSKLFRQRIEEDDEDTK